MKVTIRLYKQHDMDLIALYRNPTFSIHAAFRDSLDAYVNKKAFRIEPPNPVPVDDYIRKQYQIHLILDEETDKDMIEWLKSIKDGYRNSVLKNLVRGYLPCPVIYLCESDCKKSIDKAKEIQVLEPEKRSTIRPPRLSVPNRPVTVEKHAETKMTGKPKKKARDVNNLFFKEEEKSASVNDMHMANINKQFDDAYNIANKRKNQFRGLKNEMKKNMQQTADDILK